MNDLFLSEQDIIDGALDQYIDMWRKGRASL